MGKAALGLDGQEITPERRLRVGSVEEMRQQKPEQRIDKMTIPAAKKLAANLQGAPIKRPTQQKTRKGGRGGLGFKKADINADGADGTKGDAAQGSAKSNADFKAMFLQQKAD